MFPFSPFAPVFLIISFHIRLSLVAINSPMLLVVSGFLQLKFHERTVFQKLIYFSTFPRRYTPNAILGAKNSLYTEDVLAQELADFFYQGPDSKYFQLCGP